MAPKKVKQPDDSAQKQLVDLQELRNRDPEYLEGVFAKTNPVLLKILAANGIFNEIAEDLVHQTWERFFTNLEKFEGRSEVQTFVCGILFNKIREHRRAAGKVVYSDDSEAIFASAFTNDGWWNRESPDPSRILYGQQISKLISDCLEGLTEQQRAAFVLREVEDYETDEVCNILGVSVSNLRVLIFRAKDKLRQCLENKVS